MIFHRLPLWNASPLRVDFPVGSQAMWRGTGPGAMPRQSGAVGEATDEQAADEQAGICSVD